MNNIGIMIIRNFYSDLYFYNLQINIKVTEKTVICPNYYQILAYNLLKPGHHTATPCNSVN